MTEEIIAVDIGNSRIKIYFRDRFHAFRYDQEWEKSVQDAFLTFPREVKVVFSSVNDTKAAEFIRILEINDFNHVDIAPYLAKQKLLNVREIEGAGSDRVLGMIGALNFARPPLITVDCGTAVTINAVDANYKFIGGAIFAGVGTQKKALSEYTDKLPLVNIDKVVNRAGKNTIDAIKFGVLSSIAGGIVEAIKGIHCNNLFNSDFNIVLTGGHSYLIIHRLNAEFDNVIYREHLVIDGIVHTYRNIARDIKEKSRK